MSRDQLRLAVLLIEALGVIARDHHDIVDVGRPVARSELGQQITNQLEEIEALFHDGALT